MERRAQLFRTLITQFIILIFFISAPSVIKMMISTLDSESSNNISVTTNQSVDKTEETSASTENGSETDSLNLMVMKGLAEMLGPVLSTVQWIGIAAGTLMIGVTGARLVIVSLTGEGYEPARTTFETSPRRQRMVEEPQPDLADSLESMLASNEGSTESNSVSRIVGEKRSASTQPEDKPANVVSLDVVTRVIRDVDPESNSSEEVVKEDAEIKRIIRS